MRDASVAAVSAVSAVEGLARQVRQRCGRFSKRQRRTASVSLWAAFLAAVIAAAFAAGWRAASERGLARGDLAPLYSDALLQHMRDHGRTVAVVRSGWPLPDPRMPLSAQQWLYALVHDQQGTVVVDSVQDLAALAPELCAGVSDGEEAWGTFVVLRPTAGFCASTPDWALGLLSTGALPRLLCGGSGRTRPVVLLLTDGRCAASTTGSDEDADAPIVLH
eukprot:TRINITY_DN9043_c0_g1_i1.p2 TRINITY_DN9043_c0_g1~~TRINITY_DN9043_c0_g1_i1.p2  ORF type:complete len:232 (+),score=53.81 TRINITY_DN9043_c0_g1_i1:38-697(+)